MSIPKCSWDVPGQKDFHVFVGDNPMCSCNYPEETPKPGQSVCKHSNPDPLLCGACRLEQAVSQPHLTLETVDAQFCSDWLKDEIKRLFEQRGQARERWKMFEADLLKELHENAQLRTELAKF